jgi:hypothetical protein
LLFYTVTLSHTLSGEPFSLGNYGRSASKTLEVEQGFPVGVPSLSLTIPLLQEASCTAQGCNGVDGTFGFYSTIAFK